MAQHVQPLFKDFEIVDCAVRNENFLYLVASHVYEQDEEEEEDEDEEENDDDGEGGLQAEQSLAKEAIRIFVYSPHKPEDKRWGYRTLRHIEFMKCAASDVPVSQLVSVSMDGQVFAYGGGTSEFEERIPGHREGPLRGSVRDVVNIEGAVYVVQGNRGLCRRVGVNRWESLCAGLPISDSWQQREDQGFRSVDGTSSSNIYAGGGSGDLWHFDGQAWTRLHFPTNMLIETICCAGPTDVYVGCQSGVVFRGAGNSWKKIADGELTLPYKSMVAYQGKVWCSSDYGIWTIEGDHVSQASLPSEIYVKAGVMASRQEILLLAGTNGAAWFDGHRWTEFLNFF